MAYNYEIKHIKGETNCITDCLSRRPEWMNNKGRTVTQRNEVCLRIITESRHLLRDNPALKKLEEIGKKDDDYQQILSYIRANKTSGIFQIRQRDLRWEVSGPGSQLWRSLISSSSES